MLRPYWIDTDQPMHLGFGVTAISKADAESMIKLALPAAYNVTRTELITDMRNLDQTHVVPNMGNWMRRGIWYPLGLDHLTK